MPNRFRQVASPDDTSVTIRLWRGQAGEARGEVIGPAVTGYRLGDAGDLSLDEAMAVGCALANRYAFEVVVMDEAGVWSGRWGSLEAGRAS